MKAKKLMALVLALAMLVSSFASISVAAIDANAEVIEFSGLEAKVYEGEPQTGATIGWVGNGNNWNNKPGPHSVYFTMVCEVAGVYDMEVLAAATARTDRTFQIKVGDAEGNVAADAVVYDSTTGDTIAEVDNVQLAAGANTIIVGNWGAGDGWAPDFTGLRVEKLNDGDGKYVDPVALAAAQAVDALITALPTGDAVADGKAIQAARDAYAALTDEAKGLVENLATLTTAEATWQATAATALTSVNKIEAETGTRYGDANAPANANASGGATIGGFNWNNGNSYVTYEYYAVEEGDYIINLYSSNGGDPRNNLIDVNGEYQATVIVAYNGGWGSTFTAHYALIHLDAGNNLIKMYSNAASDYSSFAETDYFEIEKKNDGDGTIISEEDKNAAAAADALIAAIPETVSATKADYDAIEAARAAYDALSGVAKTLLTEDAATITNAEAAWNTAAAALTYNIIEAESGVVSGTAEATANANVPSGATIGGFAAADDNYVTYTYFAAEAGSYVIDMRASVREEFRNNKIDVNGVYQTTVRVTDVGTGAWSEVFADYYAIIELEKGLNEIKLYTETGSGNWNSLAETDYIGIQKMNGDKQVNVDFDITTSEYVVKEGVLTVNAQINVADDEIAAINEKAVFTDYGVYYGTSEEAVIDAVAAGEGNANCIKKSAAADQEPVNGEAEVYTVFGLRANGYAGGDRAAMFYVTYTVGGVEYTAVSDCVPYIAE